MTPCTEHLITHFDKLKRTRPLVHVIPNTVTASFCADALRALGARPIMALAPEEVSDITHSSQSVVLNMGQPTRDKFSALKASALTAASHTIPVVFDPVGVGASDFRLQGAKEIEALPWSGIIKSNQSEYWALKENRLTQTGVDTFSNVLEMPFEPSSLEREDRTYVITGERDVIFNHTHKLFVHHRNAMATEIVGTGCVLGTLCGAFVAVTSNFLEAAICACLIMSIACEKASFACESALDKGYGTYKIALLNSLSQLTVDDLITYAPLLISLS